MFFSSGYRRTGDRSLIGSFGQDGISGQLAELRILLVEDEIFVSMAIEAALAEAGAEVVGPAMSLPAAMALIEGDGDIDGAILDVNLGDALVFPLAEVLRERGVPIIFHTAMGQRPEFQAEYPDAVVCVKPTLPDQLIRQAATLFG
ncbi:MAG: response regulator [Sphingomonadaceae bacterium]|nr:response regulator [Sphingomonadaceae bacterium]